MKNILSNKDFKQKKNNLITESLDFSNRTGWSESLLGRAVNKLFSFITKNAQIYLTLNKLKNNLENEYLYGILRALAKNNIDVKDIEGKNTNINIESVELVNKNNKNDIIYNVSTYEELSKRTFVFVLTNDKNINDYNIVVKPEDENAIIKPNNIVDAKEKNKLKIVSESGVEADINVLISIGGRPKSNNTDINVSLLNLKTNKEINTPNYIDDINSIIGFSIGDKPIDYKIRVIPEDENATVEQSEYDGNSDVIVKVTAENGDVKEWNVKLVEGALSKVITSSIIKSGEESKKTEEDEDVSSVSKSTIKDIQISKFKPTNVIDKTIINQVKYISNIVKDIEVKDMTEKDKAFFIKIEEELKSELNILIEFKNYLMSNQEEAIISDDFNIEKIDQSINELKKLLNDISILLSKINIKFKISEDEYKNIVNSYNEKNSNIDFDIIKKIIDTSVIKKPGDIFKVLNDIQNNVLSKIKSDKANKIKELYRKYSKKLHPDVSDTTDKTLLYKFKNDLMNLFESLLSNDDKLFEYNYNQVNENFEILLEKKENLKDVFNRKGWKKLKSKEHQELLDKYGNIDINRIDPDKIIKLFKNNDKLRQDAINSVDKEALKELELRAEWLYDSEKYEDKRNDVYSRVNWTLTQPDMKKLKNRWYRMISSAKSIYAPFYIDNTGNFPKELDPVALINSDETFRKSFDQYDKDRLKDTKYNSVSEIQSNDNDLKKIGLSKKILVDGDVGILSINIFNTDVGLLIDKITDNGIHIFRIKGIVDIINIMKEVNNNNVNINNVILNNTYDNRKNIQDKKILNVFENIILNPKKVNNKNKTLNALYTNRNVFTGDIKFIQIISVDNEKDYFVKKVENNKTLVNINDYKTNDKIAITISIVESLVIHDNKLWKQEQIKKEYREQLLNEKIITFIKKLFNIK